MEGSQARQMVQIKHIFLLGKHLSLGEWRIQLNEVDLVLGWVGVWNTVIYIVVQTFLL